MGRSVKSYVVLLAAGGTGGHIFPAAALAERFTNSGVRIVWTTDHRGLSYHIPFSSDHTEVIESATLTGRNLKSIGSAIISLVLGFFQARRLIIDHDVAVAVGFGGYPTLPPLLAAHWLGIPCVIHEQNRVMGRANRLLGNFAEVIAVTFTGTQYPRRFSSHTIETGLPLRVAVREAAKKSYVIPAHHGAIRLLVFGGSQGASIFSSVFPAVLEHLPSDIRERIELSMQVRPECLEQTRERLSDIGVRFQLESMFEDLPERIAAAHLVVARAGASTVTELAAIGRPSILVPYARALDHDQRENASHLEAVGGCWVIEEKNLTAERLARELLGLLTNPDRLARAANSAQKATRCDGVQQLTSLIDNILAQSNP